MWRDGSRCWVLYTDVLTYFLFTIDISILEVVVSCSMRFCYTNINEFSYSSDKFCKRLRRRPVMRSRHEIE